MGVAPLLGAAILDNAEWCDHVARAAGCSTTFDDDRWWSSSSTPDLRPDAITQQPGLDASLVLRDVDVSAGCSVKDSFADLVLSGFEVLFDATWWTIRGGGDEPWFHGAGVVHHGTGDVVGVSNVTSERGWLACLAAAGESATVVGYDVEVPPGATALGPLRILVRR